MSLIGRVVVAMAASALSWVLLAFARVPFARVQGAPRRRYLRRVASVRLSRPNSANLMSYVAAFMAVTLAGTIALTG